MHYDLLEVLREKIYQEVNKDKKEAFQEIHDIIDEKIKESYTYKKMKEMEKSCQPKKCKNIVDEFDDFCRKLAKTEED